MRFLPVGDSIKLQRSGICEAGGLALLKFTKDILFTEDSKDL